MSKFNVGDEVQIISKSCGCNLKNSSIYKRGKKNNKWYIVALDQQYENGKKFLVYIVDFKKSSIYDGDYFLECDLEHYEFIKMFDDCLFKI